MADDISTDYGVLATKDIGAPGTPRQLPLNAITDLTGAEIGSQMLASLTNVASLLTDQTAAMTAAAVQAQAAIGQQIIAANNQAVPEWAYLDPPGDGVLMSPLPDGFQYYQECADNGYSVQYAKNYRNWYKFTLTGDGTGWSGDTTQDKQRAEFDMAVLSTSFPFAPTDEVWVSDEIRVDLDQVSPTNFQFCVIGQLHRIPDVGDAASPPPIEFSLQADGIHVNTYTSPSQPTTSSYTEVHQGTLPITYGEFHRRVIHAKWGADGTGILQVWWDDELVLDISNVAIGFFDTHGPRWKFGCYFGPKITGSARVSVEIRNTEVSKTSLIGRVGNPLALFGGIPLVTGGSSGPAFNTLTLSVSSFTQGTPADGTINGTIDGTTLSESAVPAGFTFNNTLATFHYDGTGDVGSHPFNLVEALGSASHTSSVGVVISAAGTTPPPSYVPSLDHSDGRNAQYL